MSGFDIDWLTLRRPADRAARAAVILGLIARDFGTRDPVSLSDLGAGSGSTRDALAAVLSPRQTWRLFDIDEALLAAAAVAEGPGEAIPVRIDLAADLERALDAPADLVTCSALLDLASAAWIDRLAAGLAARSLPFYAALSYDGRMEAEPGHPLDERILALFNEHQTSDKGFGPSLGPDAHAYAVDRLRDRGYTVVSGPSDWILGAADAALQRALVLGHETAVAELGAIAIEDLAGWRTFRLDAIDRGLGRLLVGHQDLYAVPVGDAAP